MCLSQARTRISNVICRDVFYVQCILLEGEVVVYSFGICQIDDHHCIKCVFIMGDIVLNWVRSRFS